jgi:hypothetical protein
MWPSTWWYKQNLRDSRLHVYMYGLQFGHYHHYYRTGLFLGMEARYPAFASFSRPQKTICGILILDFWYDLALPASHGNRATKPWMLPSCYMAYLLAFVTCNSTFDTINLALVGTPQVTMPELARGRVMMAPPVAWSVRAQGRARR